MVAEQQIVYIKIAFGCCCGQRMFAFAYAIKQLASGCIAHGNSLCAIHTIMHIRSTWHDTLCGFPEQAAETKIVPIDAYWRQYIVSAAP